MSPHPPRPQARLTAVENRQRPKLLLAPRGHNVPGLKCHVSASTLPTGIGRCGRIGAVGHVPRPTVNRVGSTAESFPSIQMQEQRPRRSSGADTVQARSPLQLPWRQQARQVNCTSHDFCSLPPRMQPVSTVAVPPQPLRVTRVCTRRRDVKKAVEHSAGPHPIVDCVQDLLPCR